MRVPPASSLFLLDIVFLLRFRCLVLSSVHAMPRKIHPKHTTSVESLVPIGIEAISTTSNTLIGILVDAGSGPINRCVACRLAACRLEHGRLVEDVLVLCRVELHQERLPFLNELQ